MKNNKHALFLMVCLFSLSLYAQVDCDTVELQRAENAVLSARVAVLVYNLEENSRPNQTYASLALDTLKKTEELYRLNKLEKPFSFIIFQGLIEHGLSEDWFTAVRLLQEGELKEIDKLRSEQLQIFLRRHKACR